MGTIRRIVLYLLLLFLPSAILAQDLLLLKGRVIDLKQQPIENLELKLTDLTHGVKQTYTDEQGFYHFYSLANSYTLEVLSFGNSLYTQSIQLSKSIVLPDIQIDQNIALNEIVLIASKPMLNTTQSGFKLNVIGTELEHRGNALDVLKYAPNVSIRNGLEILGSSNYKIIYNKKELNLSEAQKLLFLKNLKTQRILSIEVIDRPDASVDSDIRGLILIESEVLDGLSGGLASYVFYDNNIGNSNSLDLSYGNNKFTVYSSFYNAFHKSNLITKEYNETKDYTYNINRNSKLNREEWNFTLGGDFYLDASKTIGFFYNYTKDEDNKFSNTSNYEVESQLNPNLNQIRIQNNLENKSLDHTFMLDYTQDLDSLGSTLSGSLNYFFNSYKLPFHQKYEELSTIETLQERNQQYTKDAKDIYAFKVDWDKKFKNNSNFKLGAKYAHNKNKDLFSYYDKLNDEWKLNDLFSNDFNYKENTTAGYASYRFNINKTSLLLGTRLEYKEYNFKIDEGNTVKNNFLHILPSVLYRYKSLYFYFTNKLDYSSYYYYNPSIKKASEVDYSSGNKDLEPIKTYILQFGYTLLNKYSLTVRYGYSDNYIYTLKSSYGSGATISTPTNGGYYNYAGVYLSIPFAFFDWWQSTNKINWNFNDFYLSKIPNAQYNGSSVGIESFHTFSLTPDMDLSVDLSYNSGNTFLYIKNRESFTANLELSLPIFKNAILDVSVDDIFNSEKQGYKYDFNGIKVHSLTKAHTGRTVSVGFRYIFNKGKELETNYKTSEIESEKDKVKR